MEIYETLQACFVKRDETFSFSTKVYPVIDLTLEDEGEVMLKKT